MRKRLQTLLQQSLGALVADGTLENMPDDIRIDHCRDKNQGDYIFKIAKQISGVEKQNIFTNVCKDEKGGGDKCQCKN